MTKDKFQVLCEQVLIPRIADAIHQQLADTFEIQEAMAREMVRVGVTLNQMAASLNRLEAHADKR